MVMAADMHAAELLKSKLCNVKIAMSSVKPIFTTAALEGSEKDCVDNTLAKLRGS
jgi:hypothetical protein